LPHTVEALKVSINRMLQDVEKIRNVEGFHSAPTKRFGGPL